MFRARTFLLLVFCITLLSCLLFAQSSLSGAVAGSAWDGHHAMVPGARVILKNADTGEGWEARSGGDGVFRIGELRPGDYSLRAESERFADFQMLHVVVEVGRVTEVEVAFAVAGKQEVVEVHDEAPAVNTAQPDFASNVNLAAIDNLPINGRRWSNFALLTPGATLDGNFGLISFRRCNLPNGLAKFLKMCGKKSLFALKSLDFAPTSSLHRTFLRLS